MLKTSARRVALAGVSLAVVIGMAAMTSACGVRPGATAAEPVINPPTTSTSTPSATTPSEAPSPVAAPTMSPVPTNPNGLPIDPQAMVAAATNVEPNTTLGATVYDRFQDQVLLSVNPDRQFRSASLVKLLIAIDALNQGADEDTRQKIARMLSLSDDNLASLLWVRGGGAALVPRVAALIGLQSTEPPEAAVSGQWGEVKLTANDMVRVYQYVMDRLAPADHTLVVDALAQAPEYAADEFRQYFGIPDGLNTQWAIKQGWGNNSSAMVLHSTGLVGPEWRYLVILLTEHPLGSGWTRAARSVTAAAAALVGQLAGV